MASQHDNFRLYKTMDGNSPSRMTFLIADDGDGTSSIAANSAIIQGQVLTLTAEGTVQPAPATSDALSVLNTVGVSAWTGEANIAPIAKFDECPVVLAVPGNIFMATYDGTAAIGIAPVTRDINETGGVYTIATSVDFEQFTCLGYDSDHDKMYGVFTGGVFTGAVITAGDPV